MIVGVGGFHFGLLATINSAIKTLGLRLSRLGYEHYGKPQTELQAPDGRCHRELISLIRFHQKILL